MSCNAPREADGVAEIYLISDHPKWQDFEDSRQISLHAGRLDSFDQWCFEQCARRELSGDDGHYACLPTVLLTWRLRCPRQPLKRGVSISLSP
jgi:hypothetical protein